MSLQQTEQVDVAEIKVSNKKTTVFTLPNIGSSVAVFVYDAEKKVGGVAHIAMPESSLSSTYNQAPGDASQVPAKYADLAVPKLVEDFLASGGQKNSSKVYLVGGAQLFNFGGGAGNLLNMGARIATAIQTAMSREGLAVEKADTGGNKGRSVRFVLATGQIHVRQIGGDEYVL